MRGIMTWRHERGLWGEEKNTQVESMCERGAGLREALNVKIRVWTLLGGDEDPQRVSEPGAWHGQTKL